MHADRSPAEVVLADIDRVERRVPGVVALVQDVGLGERVVVEVELADVVLAMYRVLDQPVVRVLRIGDEEGVSVAIGHLAEDRNRCRLVGIADVVLAARRGVAAVRQRRHDHVRGVDVGAVFPFRQSEGEDVAVGEQALGPGLRILVAAHPDRADAEHRHLIDVPVAQAVEAGNFGKAADPPGVPDRVLAFLAVSGGRHQRGEGALPLAEFDEARIPDGAVVVLLEPGQHLSLEEGDVFSMISRER